MKQFLPLVVLSVFALFSSQAQTRYLDEVFPNVQEQDSIVYGQNFEFNTGFTSLQPLVMDVYTPAGDTAKNRPLILLSHNGSFLLEAYTHGLAGFCYNGRKDSSIVELCKRFARRGYVAVSFDYRLGWSATSLIQEVRTQTIIQAVYRAMQDSKNLIRYFKNDYASNNNSYGIDTGKILLGGSNSGAYVALAAGSLNDTNELNNIKFYGSHGPFLRQDTLGDFDGFGGYKNHDNYPGISSRFECVLSLGGAVGDTSWIQAGEPPVIAFHGIDEENTPFNTAVVITSTTHDPVVEVSGSGDFMPFVDALGNNNAFKPNNFLPAGPPNRNKFGQQTPSIEGLYPFYRQYFEPWNWYEPNCYDNSQQMQTLSDPHNAANYATPAKGMRYIDTIMGYTLPRLYRLFVDQNFSTYTWSGIKEIEETTSINIYPNPTSGQLNIAVDFNQRPVSSVAIYDVTGRVANEFTGINAFTKTLDVSALNNGIYVVLVKLTDGTQASHRLVIER